MSGESAGKTESIGPDERFCMAP